MKTDYKKAFKVKKRQIKQPETTETSVDMPIVVKVPIQRVEVPVMKEPPKSYPDVQQVKVINQQKAPDVQKVEVTNLLEPQKIEIPDKVKIDNLDELADKLVKSIKFPEQIKAEITNPTPQTNIPISKGNKPGEANPSEYVPVRLTDGDHFINGIGDQFVAAAKTSFPYVNATTGKQQAATVDNSGNVNTNANVSITTTSGSPLDVTVRNIPTIQKVSVQDIPAITTTTVSGQPGLNFPTVQSVYVDSLPFVQIQPGITTAVSGSLTVTSVSGTDHTIVDNFPTIQTVNVQNMPSVTTASGSSVNVANFPTYQSVNVANIPTVTVTSVSGSEHAVIDNFPAVQTVRDNSVTISGSQHTIIDNFPTVQTVITQGVTTISGQAGVTVAVSGVVTAVSGTQHVVVDNYPTIHKVSIADLPSVTVGNNITTASGSIVDIKNFPTVQTVNVQNMPNVTVGNNITTASGSIVDVKNFPTVMTVNVGNMPVVTTVSGSVGLVADGVTTAVSGIVTANQGGTWTVSAKVQDGNGTIINSTGQALNVHVNDALPAGTNNIGNVTTASGSIVDVKNFPTVQTVTVQNLPNVTSVSGTNLHTFVDNFPTQQHVWVDSPASATVTTTSGSPLNDFITNLPTVQTVNMQLGGKNQSGADVVDTANAALKVNVVAGGAGGGVADTQVRDIAGAWHDVGHRDGTDDNMPVVIKGGASTVSGTVTANAGTGNFTVVQGTGTNLHAVIDSGTITTASGSATDVKNFPTVQTVNVQNLPNVTSVSGTNLHVFVDNIPTYQDINLVNQSGTPIGVTASPIYVTTNSGLQVDVKNFPTYQSVLANLQQLNGNAIDTNSGNKSAGTQRVVIATDQPNLTSPLNVTTASGFQVDVKNFPTFQTVQQPTAANFLNIAYSTTETVYSGTQSNIIQFSPIVASAAGVTTVISGITNKVIKVIGWDLMSNGTVNVDWRSVSSQKQLTGLYYFVANTGLSKSPYDKGVFQTEKGEGLGIELSAAIAVGGSLCYITI